MSDPDPIHEPLPTEHQPSEKPSDQRSQQPTPLRWPKPLARYVESHPGEVVTLEILCRPLDVLSQPATTPDAAGHTWEQYLGRWLASKDPIRGKLVGQPVYGLIEVECPAAAVREFLALGFPKSVVSWFVDKPSRRRICPARPKSASPHPSNSRAVSLSQLVASAEAVADAFPETAFGRIASAARDLAVPAATRNPPPPLAEWVTASAGVVAATADRAAADRLLAPSATARARRLLDRAVADLGASGYMMCVLDPASEEDYRVVLAEGVKYREMLDGFWGFGSAHWAFPGKDGFEVSDRGAADDLAGASRDDIVLCTSPISALRRLPMNRWFITARGRMQFREYTRMLNDPDKRIYGAYFVREELKGLALLHGRSGTRLCLSVYLNFKREVVFGNRIRAYLRRLKDNLARLYPRFKTEFCSPIDSRLAALLLHTANELAELPAAESKGSFEECLGACLHRFLANVMEVLGVRPDEGLATLSGFNPEEYLLYPVAHAGAVPADPEAAHLKYHDALQCEGVVSWVALHRRAIRIPDVNAPHIAGLPIRLDPRVRSEIAVPMFAGDEFFAVLNVECFRPHAFTQSQLILLSLVVNPVAQAWRGCLRRRLSEELASMYDILRSRKPSPAVVRDWYDRTLCTFRAYAGLLWRVEEISSEFRFTAVVSSPPEPHEGPRANGWTSRVARTRRVVCLTDITPGQWDSYRVLVWCDDRTPGWEAPSDPLLLEKILLSPVRTGEQTLCLIGIPLIDNERCFGVLWLKYHHPNPLMIFDSLLIRDAFLVPISNTPIGSRPPPRRAPRDAYCATVNPEFMSPLVNTLKGTSLLVRHSLEPQSNPK